MNTTSTPPQVPQGEKTQNSPDNGSRNKFLIPLVAILAIIPFIVLIHKYDAGLANYTWFSAQDTQYDSFLYWKQVFLIIVSSFMLIILLSSLVMKRQSIQFKPIFIPLLIYITLAIISTACSNYLSSSLKGSMDQFESIFALISYIIICYYTFTFVKKDTDVHFIIKVLFIAAALLSLLGLTQILGHDFLATSLGEKLVLLTSSEQLTSSNNFENNRVYLSFFNPNYVGVYVSLILPILVILMLHTSNMKHNLVYGLISVGLVISLVGSQSKSGILIIAAILVLVIFLSRKRILKFKKLLIPLMICILVSCSVILVKSNMLEKIKTALFGSRSEVNLTSIETNDDNIIVHYNNNELKISVFTDRETVFNFYITDSDDNPVYYTVDEDSLLYIIQDERYPNFYLMPIMYGDYYAFDLTINNNHWYFTNQAEENTYYAINWYGKLCKFNNTHSDLFSGYESIASGRGYLWSRSLSLVKDHIVLGSGPDTFIYEFPNDDYVGLYNFIGTGQVATKPHNLYLQIAVQTGFMSLIGFLIFYLWYFISSIRIYFKGNLNTYTKQVGAGIFAGSFAYMLMGFLNDSSITVAPTFWVLLGLGIAINGMIRKEKDNA